MDIEGKETGKLRRLKGQWLTICILTSGKLFTNDVISCKSQDVNSDIKSHYKSQCQKGQGPRPTYFILLTFLFSFPSNQDEMGGICSTHGYIKNSCKMLF